MTAIQTYTYSADELPQLMRTIEALMQSSLQFSVCSRDDGEEGWTLSTPDIGGIKNHG